MSSMLGPREEKKDPEKSEARHKFKIQTKQTSKRSSIGSGKFQS